MQRNIAGYSILFSVDYSVEIVSIELEKIPKELKTKRDLIVEIT